MPGLEDAARRETLEETGWRVGALDHLVSYHPRNDISDQHFHLFMTADATERGDPADPHEAELIVWMPVDEVRSAVVDGQVRDGLSLTALTFALASDLIG